MVISWHPGQENERSPVVTKMATNKSPNRRFRQYQPPWDRLHWLFAGTVVCNQLPFFREQR